jgi:hypothetical protein
LLFSLLQPFPYIFIACSISFLGEEMQRVTLTHIGAVSLGKLLAIWSFVLGLICLVVYTLVTGLLALLAILSGADAGNTLAPLVALLAMGVAGVIGYAIFMFILGVVSATVYNIILGVGGGIDMDFKERAG